MRVRVVGCSPAWPNPGGAQSGYLVNGRVLLDCGPGVLSKLRAEADGWPAAVEAIVITHWHLDHWGDLVPWVWGRMFFAGETPRPQLWVGPGGRAELLAFEARMGTPNMWERTFDLYEYTPGEPFSVGDVTVTALHLPHYGLVNFGLRVESNGRVLAYSGDTAPSEELVRLATGADLFLCEATLLRGDLDGERRGHLALDEAIAAFEAADARRLLITHRPRELAVEGDYELAHDGLELEL